MALQNKKELGQHWLQNREILNRIADLAKGTDVALEIGPGLGTLTASLLKRFDRVIAVEYDAKLAKNLPASFPGTNLEVINEDFLQFDLDRVPAPYVAVGNIPYYITSPIIEKLLVAKNRPEKIVLLMQKEVAERIVDHRETLLSLRCKNRAEVELGPVVLRNEFTPPPEVDSQVVIFKPHEPVLSEEVMRFAQVGFSQPRKKVTRNLSVYMMREDIKDIFIKNNINIDVRPAELHLDDWQRIYDLMAPFIKKSKKVV
ncbi:ribosomal RNA small subunit methyltransferase A [Candidatus Saccharibacteria bacterium]|nr:ribosomal RNA small subunit methyltransferase A [Candidatus Saccharibacteria bacterium]